MEIADKYNGSFESNPVLHNVAAEIASRLTDLFQYDKEWSIMKHEDHTDELRGYAYIIRPSDGLRLGFCFDSESYPKRLHVSGELPRYKDGRYYTISHYNKDGDVTHRISVSLKKTAQQIARDIENRLLPGAKKRHEIAKAAIASEEEYSATHEALVKMAARVTGSKLHPNDLQRDRRAEFYLFPKSEGQGTDYSSGVTVEGRTLKVHFEISTGDMAGQLEKTREFLRSLKHPEEQEADAAHA